MATNIRRTKKLGSLQSVLLRACPPDRDGRASIPILAGRLGLSPQTLYDRWIKNGRIPQDRVSDLLLVADGRVTMEDLLPFLFKPGSSTKTKK